MTTPSEKARIGPDPTCKHCEGTGAVIHGGPEHIPCPCWQFRGKPSEEAQQRACEIVHPGLAHGNVAWEQPGGAAYGPWNGTCARVAAALEAAQADAECASLERMSLTHQIVQWRGRAEAARTQARDETWEEAARIAENGKAVERVFSGEDAATECAKTCIAIAAALRERKGKPS